MALSGTIAMSEPTTKAEARIVWSATQNQANNTSTVTINVQLRRTDGYTTVGTFAGSSTIDGTSDSFSYYGNPIDASFKTIQTQVKTITHNADGTRTCNIQSTFSNSGTSLAGTYTGNSTVTLDTIPRNSVLGTVSNFTVDSTENVGVQFSVPYTRYVGSYYDELKIYIGTTLITTKSGIGGSSTGALTENITLTSGELDTVYGAITTSNSATFTFELKTYTNSGKTTQVGSTSTKTATGTIADIGLDPTFTTYTYDEMDATVDALTGGAKFVKGYSDVKAIVSVANKATANKDGSMVNYTGTCGTDSQVVSWSSDSEVSITFNNITDGSITLTAKDARNNTTPVSVPFAYVEYTTPTLVATLERKDGTGATTLLNLTGTYHDVDFGIVSNDIDACEVRYKLTSTETWGTWTDITAYISTTTGNISNVASNEITGIEFDLAEYNIEIRVTDKLATTVYASSLDSGTPALDIVKDGSGEYHAGINGMASTTDALKVNGGLEVTGTITNTSFNNIENRLGNDANSHTIIGTNDVRATRFVPIEPTVILTVDPVDINWHDIDVTANTTPNTYAVSMRIAYTGTGSGRTVQVRPNGSTNTGNATIVGETVAGQYIFSSFITSVDADQIFEYKSGNIDISSIIFSIDGYWEYVD